MALHGNAFDYEASVSVATQLASVCLASATADCSRSGLPPYSCDGFGTLGGMYVIQTGDVRSCTYCTEEPAAEPLVHRVALGLIAAFIIAFSVAALCAHARPRSDALRRWVSCITLIASHVQTSAIIGSLCGLWPPLVGRALSCASTSYTCFGTSACLQEPEKLAKQRMAYDQASWEQAVVGGALLLPAALAMAEAALRCRRACGTRGHAVLGATGFVGAAVCSLALAFILRPAVQLLYSDTPLTSALVLLTTGAVLGAHCLGEYWSHRTVMRDRARESGDDDDDEDGDDASPATVDKPATFDEAFAAWRSEHSLHAFSFAPDVLVRRVDDTAAPQGPWSQWLQRRTGHGFAETTTWLLTPSARPPRPPLPPKPPPPPDESREPNESDEPDDASWAFFAGLRAANGRESRWAAPAAASGVKISDVTPPTPPRLASLASFKKLRALSGSSVLSGSSEVSGSSSGAQKLRASAVWAPAAKLPRSRTSKVVHSRRSHKDLLEEESEPGFVKEGPGRLGRRGRFIEPTLQRKGAPARLKTLRSTPDGHGASRTLSGASSSARSTGLSSSTGSSSSPTGFVTGTLEGLPRDSSVFLALAPVVPVVPAKPSVEAEVEAEVEVQRAAEGRDASNGTKSCGGGEQRCGSQVSFASDVADRCSMGAWATIAPKRLAPRRRDVNNGFQLYTMQRGSDTADADVADAVASPLGASPTPEGEDEDEGEGAEDGERVVGSVPSKPSAAEGGAHYGGYEGPHYGIPPVLEGSVVDDTLIDAGLVASPAAPATAPDEPEAASDELDEPDESEAAPDEAAKTDVVQHLRPGLPPDLPPDLTAVEPLSDDFVGEVAGNVAGPSAPAAAPAAASAADAEPELPGEPAPAVATVVVIAPSAAAPSAAAPSAAAPSAAAPAAAAPAAAAPPAPWREDTRMEQIRQRVSAMRKTAASPAASPAEDVGASGVLPPSMPTRLGGRPPTTLPSPLNSEALSPLTSPHVLSPPPSAPQSLRVPQAPPLKMPLPMPLASSSPPLSSPMPSPLLSPLPSLLSSPPPSPPGGQGGGHRPRGAAAAGSAPQPGPRPVPGAYKAAGLKVKAKAKPPAEEEMEEEEEEEDLMKLLGVRGRTAKTEDKQAAGKGAAAVAAAPKPTKPTKPNGAAHAEIKALTVAHAHSQAVHAAEVQRLASEHEDDVALAKARRGERARVRLRRLAFEVSLDGFLRNRFADHAYYWQALTWGLQLCLLLLSSTSAQMWHPSADGVGTAGLCRLLLAALLVAVFWAAHTLVEPHEFEYQHVASSWCYAAHATLLVTAWYFEGHQGDLTLSGGTSSLSYVGAESLALLAVVLVPLGASAYLYVGLRSSRVLGRSVGHSYWGSNGGCDWGCDWEELYVRDGDVPINLSALSWARLPLPAGGVAITHISPNSNVALWDRRWPTAQAKVANGTANEAEEAEAEAVALGPAFVPTPTEVYTRLLRGGDAPLAGEAEGGGGEGSGKSKGKGEGAKKKPPPPLGKKAKAEAAAREARAARAKAEAIGRKASFLALYSRLVRSFLKPNLMKEVIERVERDGPQATTKELERRLDELSTTLWRRHEANSQALAATPPPSPPPPLSPRLKASAVPAVDEAAASAADEAACSSLSLEDGLPLHPSEDGAPLSLSMAEYREEVAHLWAERSKQRPTKPTKPTKLTKPTKSTGLADPMHATMPEPTEEPPPRKAAAAVVALERSKMNWPMRANRAEPTSRPLEHDMGRVLRLVEAETPELLRLGMSLQVCVHMHRDAAARGTSAARVWQRWWLTLIDHHHDASKALADPIVTPNAWLGNWRLRGLRLDEPGFSQPAAGTYHTVGAMVRRGTALVYDRMGTVLAMPPGTCLVPLPLTCESLRADSAHSRASGRMSRCSSASRDSFAALSGHGRARTKAHKEDEENIIADEEADYAHLLPREPVAFSCAFSSSSSAAAAFQKRAEPVAVSALLTCDMSGRARDVCLLRQYRQLLRELCDSAIALRLADDDADDDAADGLLRVRLVHGSELRLPRVAAFPRLLSDETGPKISVHLCAADTLHEGPSHVHDEIEKLGPAPMRDTLCWLALVDLEVHRPLGRYNLPWVRSNVSSIAGSASAIPPAVEVPAEAPAKARAAKTPAAAQVAEAKAPAPAVSAPEAVDAPYRALNSQLPPYVRTPYIVPGELHLYDRAFVQDPPPPVPPPPPRKPKPRPPPKPKPPPPPELEAKGQTMASDADMALSPRLTPRSAEEANETDEAISASAKEWPAAMPPNTSPNTALNTDGALYVQPDSFLERMREQAEEQENRDREERKTIMGDAGKQSPHRLPAKRRVISADICHLGRNLDSASLPRAGVSVVEEADEADEAEEGYQEARKTQTGDAGKQAPLRLPPRRQKLSDIDARKLSSANLHGAMMQQAALERSMPRMSSKRSIRPTDEANDQATVDEAGAPAVPPLSTVQVI